MTALIPGTETPVRDWLQDMRAAFGEVRVRYIRGPGMERGSPGELGIVPILRWH